MMKFKSVLCIRKDSIFIGKETGGVTEEEAHRPPRHAQRPQRRRLCSK